MNVILPCDIWVWMKFKSVLPRWGAADAEIEVLLLRMQCYQRLSSFKAETGHNIALHASSACLDTLFLWILSMAVVLCCYYNWKMSVITLQNRRYKTFQFAFCPRIYIYIYVSKLEIERKPRLLRSAALAGVFDIFWVCAISSFNILTYCWYYLQCWPRPYNFN